MSNLNQVQFPNQPTVPADHVHESLMGQCVSCGSVEDSFHSEFRALRVEQERRNAARFAALTKKG